MPPSICSMLYFLSLWKDYSDKDYPSSSTFLLIWFDPSDRPSDPWENVALTRSACQSAFSIKETKALIYALMIFRSRDFRVPLFRERHARDSLTEWAASRGMPTIGSGNSLKMERAPRIFLHGVLTFHLSTGPSTTTSLAMFDVRDQLRRLTWILLNVPTSLSFSLPLLVSLNCTVLITVTEMMRDV